MSKMNTGGSEAIQVQQSARTSNSMTDNDITLRKENDFLKNQVERLNKELAGFQKNDGKNLSCDNNDIELPEWITDSQLVAPLFRAYDNRIKELSTCIEQQGSILDVLTLRSNDLLSENEKLRNKIIQDLPMRVNNLSTANNNKNDYVCDQAPNKGNYKQLLQDKQLLEEQANLLIRELQDTNRSILARDDNISTLTTKLADKTKTIQTLNVTVSRLTRAKYKCEEELVTRIKDIATQSNEVQNLKICIDSMKKERYEISLKVEGTNEDKQYLEVENDTLTAKVSNVIDTCYNRNW